MLLHILLQWNQWHRHYHYPPLIACRQQQNIKLFSLSVAITITMALSPRTIVLIPPSCTSQNSASSSLNFSQLLHGVYRPQPLPPVHFDLLGLRLEMHHQMSACSSSVTALFLFGGRLAAGHKPEKQMSHRAACAEPLPLADHHSAESLNPTCVKHACDVGCVARLVVIHNVVVLVLVPIAVLVVLVQPKRRWPSHGSWADSNRDPTVCLNAILCLDPPNWISQFDLFLSRREVRGLWQPARKAGCEMRICPRR